MWPYTSCFPPVKAPHLCKYQDMCLSAHWFTGQDVMEIRLPLLCPLFWVVCFQVKQNVIWGPPLPPGDYCEFPSIYTNNTLWLQRLFEKHTLKRASRIVQTKMQWDVDWNGLQLNSLTLSAGRSRYWKCIDGLNTFNFSSFKCRWSASHIVCM